MTLQKSGRRMYMLFAVVIAAMLMVSTFAKTALGKSDYANWNEVAEAMDKVLDDAYDAYVSGDTDAAYKGVNNAYYGYYETEGFERTVMGYISGARKTEVELQFSACKTAVKKNASNDEFRAELDKLSNLLHEDANILDGTDGSGGASNPMATFFACFTIILREGLEAILIVGAILAYLIKSGNKDKTKPVYLGSVIAIVLSFAAAFALYMWKQAASEDAAMSQELIEGVTALIAVAVLFYVSNWMVSKSESAVWSRYIEGKVAGSVAAGSMFALGFTAFLAVFREGAEVILFYQPFLTEGANTLPVWLGLAVGLACLVVVYVLIRFMSIKLPLKPFFLGTSILMFVMSISFLGSGIQELIDGNIITQTTPIPWIPNNEVLQIFGIYPCVQTIVPQLILLAITVVTFVIQIRRNNRIKKEALAAQAAENAKDGKNTQK